MSDDQPPSSPRLRLEVTRRRLLQGLGLVLVEAQLPACGPGFTLPTRTRSVEVVRPEDRLWLRFDFYNLDLDAKAPADAPRLVRVGAGDAYLVVTFPPQSVGERVLRVNQVNGVDLPAEPVPARAEGMGARLSGESRLAFRVPDGVDALPYSLEALLDWSALEPSLAPAARGPTPFDGNPGHRAPSPTETALELPWWLVVSPLADARWAHAAAPVTHGGRTELWHTRLGAAGSEGVDEAVNSGVRAVWARDPNLPGWLLGATSPDDTVGRDGRPFVMAAKPGDRLAVIRNTSDWSQAGSSFLGVKVLGYRPTPFAARRLHLSALGATADLDGAWNPPQAFGSLVAWAHRLSLGRDVFARIVHRGFLYPFGHACVEVTLTERKFRSDTGTRVAYLVQRQFLVITERTRRYGGALGLPLEGRGFPFREVEIVTRQTRDFAGHRVLMGNAPPQGEPLPEGGNAWAYQPMVDLGLTEPVVVDCLGTDWTGRVVPFQSPFAFVADADDLAYDPVRMEAIAAAFARDDVVPPAHRTAKVGGHKVAFAEEAQPGDTSVELHELVLGARKAVAEAGAAATDAFRAAKQLCGFPAMAEALVAFPATQALAGASELASKLKFAEQYLQDGFGATNPGGAFLEFTQQRLMDVATDAAGGLVSPAQQLTAVTRALGPVGGRLEDVVADTFKPDDVFDQFGKLLGGVPLKKILEAVDDVRKDVDRALKWLEQRRPTELVASFKWKPKLKRDEPLHVFEPKAGATAFFQGEARQSLKDASARSAKAWGELTNFRLNLIGDGETLFLRLDVAAVRFRAGTGQKTSLDVTVEKVTFDGALAFVEKLRPFLEALGQGPSSLPIPKGIEVSAGLHIPKVQLGVFQLANLGFDAKLVVPFTGEPVRFRFRFATKEDPFTLSVSIFGGTGYFALGVGADGVELVEIAFEFGGMLALDVGVASGSIKAVAGIYLKLEKQNGADRLELTGYLKLTGQLQVLGIVSVSLLLDLSFQYLHKPLPDGGALDIVTGRARCELKVSILFFSISVGFDVEKSFGGDPADPTVADQFSLPDWQEYAAAFA